MKIGETNGRLEGDRDKVRFVQTNMGRLILAAQMDRTGADFAGDEREEEFVILSKLAISAIKTC